MIKKIIKKILPLIPTKNIIVFESTPNLSDNTKAVFDEFISRDFNKKYKLVWIVSKANSDLPVIENVSYCDKKRRGYKLKLLYYRIFAKALISCNDYLITLREGQVSFYLTHGTPIKSVKSYYTIPQNIDYILIDGEATKKICSYEFNADIKKFFALGFPRNDVLVNTAKDISTLFSDKGEKIAVWYPTFRQHKNGHGNTTNNALPILHDEKQAIILNEIAKANNVILVLKPHFAQDVSKIKACNLSNIKFINDEFFIKNNITSYEFIASCDALISDYSSVYYDYLLCNKPIGLVWEDFDEYKKTVNFAVDMDYYMKAGHKIYTIEDFEEFLKNIASSNDKLESERAEISTWANYSNDGKSSQRVVDFIIEKAKL